MRCSAKYLKKIKQKNRQYGDVRDLLSSLIFI